MKYLIIFFKQDNKNKELIVDFLRGLLGNVTCLNKSELVISYNYKEDINFKEITNMIINDMFIDISLLEVETSEEEYLDVLIDLYKNLKENTSHLNEKKLLLLSSKIDNNFIKQNILKSYYNDLEMLNILKVFLECNMNTSVAAGKLYLHRNTLINKIDKFINITGYDIKNFKDASIIYQLL